MIQLKHSRWVRWTHWVNFPLLFLMIWSGNLIYWANDVYGPFFPKAWYEALGWDHRLAEGMGVHFTLMWLFAVNGLIYFLYLVISGEWRERIPRPRHFIEAWYVTLHELGLRKEAPAQGKFNAAQRIAYTGVDLMGVLAILTGLAIYKPIQLHWLARMLGGYDTARLLHFALMLGFLVFFLIHVIQVARAGWNNLRSMITGWEKYD